MLGKLRDIIQRLQHSGATWNHRVWVLLTLTYAEDVAMIRTLLSTNLSHGRRLYCDVCTNFSHMYVPRGLLTGDLSAVNVVKADTSLQINPYPVLIR